MTTASSSERALGFFERGRATVLRIMRGLGYIAGFGNLVEPPANSVEARATIATAKAPEFGDAEVWPTGNNEAYAALSSPPDWLQRVWSRRGDAASAPSRVPEVAVDQVSIEPTSVHMPPGQAG